MTVDLSAQKYPPICELDCDQPGVIIAKGCGDARPVIMCQAHFDRGIEIISAYVHLWQRLNHRVMICGQCYRPIISLDTHLDAKEIQ